MYLFLSLQYLKYDKKKTTKWGGLGCRLFADFHKRKKSHLLYSIHMINIVRYIYYVI